MEGMNDPHWRKSTYSGSNGGGCVEAGNLPNGIMIRDTQHPRWPDSGPVIAFSADAWSAFLGTLR